EIVKMELLDSGAELIRTTLKVLKNPEKGGRTDIRFFCLVRIKGVDHRFEREISTQKSFYEPWVIEGVVWYLDAVRAIFDFLQETHGECKPAAEARFALHDASTRICPEKLMPWCPLPEGGLRIEDCFRGEDCWLGAYNGADAHGGLDINHPKGTPLYTPLAFDDHFYFNSVEMGHNNNRWRALRRWEDGSVWILQAHHMEKLLVPEHGPLPAGVHFASAAGVWCGLHDHSHFVFKILDQGELYALDPWILFRQMYIDNNLR
ncbi:MAG: hypothetical protein JNL74_14565, partial [Fibrobacteres bacterium]|nr:hypothetical protein [Fibrobacterota bacterium]